MIDLFGTKKQRRRREMWARIATELGGSFHVAQGWFWRRKNERIEVVQQGVPIVLDTYVVSTGKTHHTYTRVAGDFARGPGRKLTVQRHGVFASLGNALGMDDIVLGGSPEFDAMFVVRCGHPAVARRLWTQRAQQLMLESLVDAKLTVDRKSVNVVASGVWDQEQTLRAGIELIAELAARDLYGVEALRAVEGGTLVWDAQDAPSVELAVPVRIVIKAEDRDGQLVMVARAAETVPGSVDLDIIDGAAMDHERASKLPPGAHVTLREVGTGTLRSAGELTFTWRSLELDPARLRRGAELLGAIAAGRGEDVYR